MRGKYLSIKNPFKAILEEPVVDTGDLEYLDSRDTQTPKICCEKPRYDQVHTTLKPNLF
jgi:hypothetical protein